MSSVRPGQTICTAFGLPPDTLAWAIAAAVSLVVVVPLELSQLIFLILGAAAYSLLHAVSAMPHRPNLKKAAKAGGSGGSGTNGGSATCEPAPPRRQQRSAVPAVDGGAATAPGPRRGPTARAGGRLSSTLRRLKASGQPACCEGPRPSVTPSVTPSVKPVAPPTFETADFDAQVDELVCQIKPTPETEQLVQQLAKSVTEIVRHMLPDTEITGVACGNATGGTAFGVAVPEVEIVASISPKTLACLQESVGHPSEPESVRTEARRMQKVATRICTDRLVASGAFKFRRSAFRALEPKVTLLAVGAAQGESVPFDLLVNCATPLCNSALLTECGQIEPRARDLILLVRRWAKDRGVCHAAKGHLPPYGWTLLVVYFLQVGVTNEGPLLPPLCCFRHTSGMPRAAAAPSVPPPPGLMVPKRATWKPPASGETKMSVGALFRAFVEFYSVELDWRQEAVAVHLGRRAPPELAAELHIVLHDDQSAEVAPTIQDPFEPCRNVAACLTADGLVRLRAELGRARGLNDRGAALAELLETWSPEEPLAGISSADLRGG